MSLTTAYRHGGGGGTAVGFLVDRVTPEPGDAWHPVARFGQLMTAVERRLWHDNRMAGIAFAAIGVTSAVGVGVALDRTFGRGPAAAIAASISIGGSMLDEVAGELGQLVRDGQLDAARRRLTALVGRETASLDDSEIARATIESLAENTIDATIAPIMWGAVAGAPGILAHRAVNTLDAMVGHRSTRYRRFGWATARLDDVMNWIPARLGAAIVAALRPSRATTVLRVIRGDAPAHPSPNGGVIEAAFAAALDIRLGGTNRYGDLVENRGMLGDGASPSHDDISRATRLATQVGAVTAALAAGIASFGRR